MQEKLKLVVAKTVVKKQPSTDYIAILPRSHMVELEVEDNDYITLMNAVTNGKDPEVRLEILAQVINSEHELSKMKPSDPDALKLGEVGVDQTCREALGLKIGQEVTLSNPYRKYDFIEKLLTRLEYQKAVVRVQVNEAYFERKTPIVCLCAEVMTSIGVGYGDKIELEYKGTRTVATCAKLTERMQEFHEYVLNPAKNTKLENSRLLKYPEDYNIKSGYLESGEMTHPIFMDTIARNLLSVDALYPVKIRKSFKWQILKALNRFGTVSVIAFSVLLGLYLERAATLPLPESIFYWAWIAAFGGWAAWSVLTSSTYNVSGEHD